MSKTNSSYRDHNNDSSSTDWISEECKDCQFADKRLATRFRRLLGQLEGADASSVPWACEDWANAKAAYRFFDNDRIEGGDILAGHFAATARRARQEEGQLLVLHDSTQFSFNREAIGQIGVPKFRPKGKQFLLHGLMMHSSLVVTEEGVPLGLAAARFWTRGSFKGTNANKRVINPTRVPIEEKESYRWLENIHEADEQIQLPGACVHIGDREADIFELFSLACVRKTRFLVRTCVDRLVADGYHSLEKRMAAIDPAGIHTIEIIDAEGKSSQVQLQIKFEQMTVMPPVGKQKMYQPLELTAIHAEETNPPSERPKIIWKLLTNLPVADVHGAVEKLRWYALRWRIETFHKVLKSGCRIEESGLRTKERLTRLISACCVVSWRVYWVTIIRRSNTPLPPEAALTPTEIKVLDHLKTNAEAPGEEPTLDTYILKIAKLGGYLARKGDPPPGPVVIWRGFRRLNPMVEMAELMNRNCG